MRTIDSYSAPVKEITLGVNVSGCLALSWRLGKKKMSYSFTKTWCCLGMCEIVLDSRRPPPPKVARGEPPPVGMRGRVLHERVKQEWETHTIRHPLRSLTPVGIFGGANAPYNS